MIEVIRIEQEQDFKTATAIRENVFVIGQGVPREAEYDQYEEVAKHYMATYNGIACGAARWRKTEQGVKLERFAVLEEFRNKNVGAKVLELVLEDVRSAYPDSTIYLHAQVAALNFYLRNGFETEGEMFSECDINHYKMTYKG
ncbi:GNAT family N-acetyltransferase [Pontibacter sp. SGAir0037]|uniref:GNAT family N-acetyltransferase n=1 Tax=Pontibacter sp. SGAir0037 TaxID=2571030 RepID=UPI0010CCDF19|nr:GNAT family N-acetyltransferase [Pontibacter sp. SGAir0037]QCR21146.1 GNAT family N-acetyltransferase [Pontibacter sp. SGAir0037]